MCAAVPEAKEQQRIAAQIASLTEPALRASANPEEFYILSSNLPKPD